MNYRKTTSKIIDRAANIASDIKYRFIYKPHMQSNIDGSQKLAIYSVFVANINPDVVKLQRDVFAHLELEIEQVEYSRGDADYSARYHGHGNTIERIIQESSAENMIFFDIDCIPLSRAIVEYVYKPVIEAGALIGPIQVGNHLADRRPYAAPCALGISKTLYKRLGSPRLRPTRHMDVAAILTRESERLGIPVVMLPVTDCVEPRWPLGNNPAKLEFGHGTTYAEGIYHAFGVSEKKGEQLFINKCRSVIENNDSINSSH